MQNATKSIQHEQPLTGVVLDTIAITKRLFNEVKTTGVIENDWSPLAALVAVDEFVWVSPTYEQLNWQEYIAYLTGWAQTVIWRPTIQRIHQWQNIVYLEHEEQSTIGDRVDVSYCVSIYEFNDAGKIRRMANYQQQRPSLGL